MTMLLSPQILAVENGILTPIETTLANPSPGIIMEVDEISQKTPTPNTKTLSIVSSNFFHLNCQAKWNISDQKTSNEDFHPNILRGRVLIAILVTAFLWIYWLILLSPTATSDTSL
ncbi:hypothetical protein LSA_10730 [Fructilactobacillus sanfranciscensis TMW 1.1304]|uniref:Uncharacterized protein n=1 Tax=Fructilactobacillus sanfranciscensis (strain TMW 1.1304) TaxID=714313 RepID=G2KVT8_FRUST|nr:hypothetical protein LSA_10730 [Fructilactobacillus sanfranciscensis TMW 1.1304]POH22062.1 hypothetical protein BGL47_06135 [Fructilactobacillus sanfranciscensis]